MQTRKTVAPRNQEPGAWRYKTSTRRFLLREKYGKQRFFMKRTPVRIVWHHLFTARLFLIETQKLGCFNMSRLTTLKARQAVSGNFPETRTHGEFIMQRHYIHALYDEKHHIINISSKQELDNSISINLHPKSRDYQAPKILVQTSCVAWRAFITARWFLENSRNTKKIYKIGRNKTQMHHIHYAII